MHAPVHLVNVMADAWEVYLRAKGAYNIKPFFYVKKIYIVSARALMVPWKVLAFSAFFYTVKS